MYRYTYIYNRYRQGSRKLQSARESLFFFGRGGGGGRLSMALPRPGPPGVSKAAEESHGGGPTFLHEGFGVGVWALLALFGSFSAPFRRLSGLLVVIGSLAEAWCKGSEASKETWWHIPEIQNACAIEFACCPRLFHALRSRIGADCW